MLEKKYQALRTVAVLLKILAFIVLIGFVLLGIVVIAESTAAGEKAARMGGGLSNVLVARGAQAAIILIVVGVLMAVFIYATAEMILLMIDVEENTRATRELLKSEWGYAKSAAKSVSAPVPDY